MVFENSIFLSPTRVRRRGRRRFGEGQLQMMGECAENI